MSAVSVARTADKAHGPTLDLYRGFVPRALLLHWIAKETTTRGRPFDRFAVSIDKRLIEVGWSQAPLSRAWSVAGGVDPFNPFGACYLAGREALDDAGYWTNAKQVDDEGRKQIAAWLPRRDRNLWWAVECDYSVGTGALRHVIRATIARASAKGRSPDARGLLAEALDWAEHTDLAAPAHRGYWGRQSAQQIDDRLHKHAEWIDDAAEVGPIDDAPEGDYPTDDRPPECSAFPVELIGAARVVSQRDATTDECARSWDTTRTYVRARRRREFAPAPRLRDVVKGWIAEAAPAAHPVIIERDDGWRAVSPW